MASVNKVIVLGNLGRDPEVKYATSGVAVCNLTVATSRKWKDKAGDKVEETEWHRLVAYDKLAEIIGQYLKKGSSAYFEGRLKTRKWQDKEGADRYTTEIVIEQLQMLGGRDDGEQRQSPPVKPAQREQQREPAKRGGFDDMDDDIPF